MDFGMWPVITRGMDITGIEQAVLIQILAEAYHSRVYLKSLQKLTDDCKFSRSSVVRTLHSLEAKGLIRVNKHEGKKHTIDIIFSYSTHVTQTPVSEGHPCQPDIGPMSERHDTHVTVTSPLVLVDQRIDQRSDQRRIPGVPPDPLPAVEGIEIILDEPLSKKAKKKSYKFEQSHLSLALEWKAFTTEQMPHLEARVNIEAWADALRRIQASIKCTEELLKNVFDFVKQDEFWRKNALSPERLLDKSRNGLRKIDNVLNGMRNSPQAKRNALLNRLSEEAKQWNPESSTQQKSEKKLLTPW